MRAYDKVHPMVNLPELPSYAAPSWTLERRLAWLRDVNPSTTTGAGARRRSAHEHEVDEFSALLRACVTPGAVVSIRRRRNGGPQVRAGSVAGATPHGRGWATVEPYRLVHELVDGPARALRAYRAALTVAVDWWAEHGPAHGWALRQSAPRAARLPEATSWYLPRASWGAFYVARAVGRWVAAALLTLHDWWDALIPAPRPRSEAEGRGAGARASARQPGETGTRCRDQRAGTWEDVARRIQLHLAM